MATTIILVRHGQTEWNRVERFRGRVDVPLNDTGLRQAEATGRRVADMGRPVALYSSPLARAIKTAEAIGRHTTLPVAIHPGLVDIDYGDWQALTPDEVRGLWPEMIDAWYNTPHLAIIPGGESLVEIRVRAMRAVGDLASRHAGQTIVMVSHTVINRIILMCAMGIGNERFWHIRQEPCAINVFEAVAGEYTLVSLNDTCHLSELTSK
jgi:phosphoserine phosphatase